MIHKSLLSCVAASALVISINSEATLITANFTSTVTSGDFLGSTASGSFSYDSLSITGSGFEQVSVGTGLTVNLTVFGQNFTEVDDIAFSSGLPALEFLDGTPYNLDFLVSETVIFEDGDISDDITAINLEGVNDFGEFSLNFVSENTYDGEFFVNEVSAVPVPAAAWLFGSGLLGLVGVARRKKA